MSNFIGGYSVALPYNMPNYAATAQPQYMVPQQGYDPNALAAMGPALQQAISSIAQISDALSQVINTQQQLSAAVGAQQAQLGYASVTAGGPSGYAPGLTASLGYASGNGSMGGCAMHGNQGYANPNQGYASLPQNMDPTPQYIPPPMYGGHPQDYYQQQMPQQSWMDPSQGFPGSYDPYDPYAAQRYEPSYQANRPFSYPVGRPMDYPPSGYYPAQSNDRRGPSRGVENLLGVLDVVHTGLDIADRVDDRNDRRADRRASRSSERGTAPAPAASKPPAAGSSSRSSSGASAPRSAAVK